MIGNWIDAIGPVQWMCVCVFAAVVLIGTVVAAKDSVCEVLKGYLP